MMMTDSYTTLNTALNMDGLLVQILRLHDQVYAVDEFSLHTSTQQDSLALMQELVTNLCAMWVTDDELAALSFKEKSALRHDFMNALHGIMGFVSLILREGLSQNIVEFKQIKQQAHIIQQDVTIVTKGQLLEMVE